MSTLYLVKDGDRIVRLAVEQDGKIYGYVPNVKAFVYNRSATIDFSVDRELTYEITGVEVARQIIAEGVIGHIDPHAAAHRLQAVRSERRRLEMTVALITAGDEGTLEDSYSQAVGRTPQEELIYEAWRNSPARAIVERGLDTPSQETRPRKHRPRAAKDTTRE